MELPGKVERAHLGVEVDGVFRGDPATGQLEVVDSAALLDTAATCRDDRMGASPGLNLLRLFAAISSAISLASLSLSTTVVRLLRRRREPWCLRCVPFASASAPLRRARARLAAARLRF